MNLIKVADERTSEVKNFDPEFDKTVSVGWVPVDYTDRLNLVAVINLKYVHYILEFCIRKVFLIDIQNLKNI